MEPDKSDLSLIKNLTAPTLDGRYHQMVRKLGTKVYRKINTTHLIARNIPQLVL